MSRKDATEGYNGRIPRKDVMEGCHRRMSQKEEVYSRQEKKEGGTLSQININAWIIFQYIDC